MLQIEPPRSQADIHFRVLGIPVRVHPFFWLITVLLGVEPDMRGRDGMIELLLWIAVVFVSILVHELGHALMARRFGWEPWITLHGFGGLASYQPTYDDPKKQILITIAGPAAGFLLAGIVLALLAVAGRPIYFYLGGPLGFRWSPPEFENFNLVLLVHFILSVNIFWGLMNLLPIYPLDGGRITREVLTMRDARQGMIASIWVSIVAAILIAVLALFRLDRPLFPALMFGYFAYINYQILQAYTGRGGYGGYGGYGGDRW